MKEKIEKLLQEISHELVIGMIVIIISTAFHLWLAHKAYESQGMIIVKVIKEDEDGMAH